MLINANTVLIGENVELVPYEKEHVPKYHRWMTNEDLLALTASEPLSIEEEYEMQESWRKDEDKLTFIVLGGGGGGGESSFEEEEKRMIGDVNLFLNDNEDRTIAEIDIMIAEADFRGRGCGREAVLLMIHYAYSQLGVRSFQAKISDSNVQSQGLFKKLGFVQESHSEVFQETTFGFKPTDEQIAAMPSSAKTRPYRQ